MSEKSFSWKKSLIDGLLIAFALFLIQSAVNYFVQPSSITRAQQAENLYIEKKKAYFDAIDVINRMLVNTSWKGEGVPENLDSIKITGGEKPSSLEASNSFAKLAMFSDNKEIIEIYKSFFIKDTDKRPETERLAILVNLMRKDLGNSGEIINPNLDDYKIMMTIKEPIKNE